MRIFSNYKSMCYTLGFTVTAPRSNPITNVAARSGWDAAKVWHKSFISPTFFADLEELSGVSKRNIIYSSVFGCDLLDL